MPEILESYQFNAQVKALGQQRKGEGWTLTLDWKLPGSQYELVLYGQDWADVEGLAVAKTAYFDIAKGNLKQDKSGKYASDYFWNLSTIGEPQADVPAPTPSSSGERGPGSQDEYRRSKEEMRWTEAVSNATNLLAADTTEVENDTAEQLKAAILDWAAWYYQAIISGPPSLQQETPAEAPSVPAQPPQQAQASKTPATAQQPSFEALSAFNGAWKAALARNQWPTEEQALAAVEGFIARNYGGRKLRQLSDAEVTQVTAAVRNGKL